FRHTARLCTTGVERGALRQMARIRRRGHDPVLRSAHARGRHDQIEPQRDHRCRHGLALPQRAQARAEDVRMRWAIVVVLAALAWPLLGLTHDASHHATQDARLPTIGPAPDFVLTSQDGARVSLSDYKGKVVAITFIFVSCTDTCPLLT